MGNIFFSIKGKVKWRDEMVKQMDREKRNRKRERGIKNQKERDKGRQNVSVYAHAKFVQNLEMLEKIKIKPWQHLRKQYTQGKKSIKNMQE